MKKTVVSLVLLLALFSTLLMMPSVAKAQARSKKASCLTLIYPCSPTISLKHADNYKGPMNDLVKKNLKKLVGVKGKTKNHYHAKRNFGKLNGKQTDMTSRDYQRSETFAKYDRMKKRR